jgi:DNA polymerase III epsilon subunit-like protein
MTDKNVIEKKRSYIIQPEGWTIPPDSTRIHGITNEEAVSQGVSLHSVINEFLNEKYDILIAHNMEFDYNVLMNAIRWDLDLVDVMIDTPLFCTMQASKSFCRIPYSSGGGSKPPKLKELYFHTFGRNPDEGQLHNSMYDTMLLVDILKGSYKLRDLLTVYIDRVIRNAPQQDNPTILSFSLA